MTRLFFLALQLLQACVCSLGARSTSQLALKVKGHPHSHCD